MPSRRLPSRLGAPATLALWIGIGASALALACATPRATLEAPELSRPVVERLSDQELRVRWPADFSSGQVRISWSAAPDGATRWQEPVQVATGSARVRRRDGGSLALDRPLYFELVAEDVGRSAIVSERRLPLEGADNFRDLGGYRGAGDRELRWGMLFRSNDLAGLSQADLEYLSHIGVRLVCDLRTAPERAEHPDATREETDIGSLLLPVEQKGIEAELLRGQILSGGIAAPAIERSMHDAYRGFAADYTESWARLLRRLADPGSPPSVIHCTAGKDRTGFASALVLLALGVPEETIFEDYLLTNRYRSGYRDFVLRWVPLASLFRTRPEDLLPLLEARREYLESALDAMVALHGSTDRYLEQALGVDARLRRALRDKLLR